MPMARNQLLDECTNETPGHQQYGVSIAAGKMGDLDGRVRESGELVRFSQLECESHRLIIRQQLKCPAPEDGLNRSGSSD